MTFSANFTLTTLPSSPSDTDQASLDLRAGVYNAGLLTILGDSLGGEASRPWQWLLGRDARALASTSFGDLFFWSGRMEAVYFLEVERGTTTFVDKEVSYVFNDFLNIPEIQDRVLHRTKATLVIERCGALAYGQCYIGVPLPSLGGSGDASTYQPGMLGAYLSLVAQEARRRLDASRTGSQSVR
ncbi:T6SS immunity protein Tdi1 domain-containing protein [Paraburkholderia sp. BR10936]|uniref:T6SS immunity protein Tdi1 domain-containing protein n=1 Tax=Paraburkholderia sp. BR10936 TaxID=3236993 RepID=UPI0034D2D5D5